MSARGRAEGRSARLTIDNNLTRGRRINDACQMRIELPLSIDIVLAVHLPEVR